MIPNISIGRVAAALLLAGLAACNGTREDDGANANAPAVQINFSASATDVTTGSTTTLNWTATNATGCSASGGWSGARAISGSQVVTPAAGSTVYSLICTGPGSPNAANLTVTAHAGPAAVQLTFSAAPTQLTVGGTSVLTWSATNATACVAGGGWTGTRAVSGSVSVTPPLGSTVYSLTCSGAGAPASMEVTVTASTEPPQQNPDVEFQRTQQLEQGCCNATN